MPLPPLLRGALGLMAVFFAHFLGRTAGRVQRGKARPLHMLSWTLRTVVSLLGVCWFGFDTFSIVVIGLVLLSGGWGFFDEWRPKRGDDYTGAMFPGD